MTDDAVTRETVYFFRRLTDPFTVAGQSYDPYYWLAVLIPLGLLAVAFNVWMYRRDARRVGPWWAGGLGCLRTVVFLTLILIFLQPARREDTTTVKRSRVLVLLDVSPSMTKVSDELPSPGQEEPPERRFAKVAGLLADDQVKLIRGLTDKNPVFVYRFGGRLDNRPTELPADDAPKAQADWAAWADIDFKKFVLGGLSEAGQKALKQTAGWAGPAPGDAAWAEGWLARGEGQVIPKSMGVADRDRLLANRKRLGDRLAVARELTGGTDVPGSLLEALNREAGNTVEAIILVSDGRSTSASEALVREARQRAEQADVPVFTVAVGKAPRRRTEIRITDVRVPKLTPPDEPFKVAVEVDGEGLAGKTAKVYLDVIPPGEEAPSRGVFDPPFKEVRFKPGEPPHALAEFVINPAAVPENLRNPEPDGLTPELVQGEWKFVARVPRAKGEAFPEPEHVSDPPAKVKVRKSPLRVLMMASAPNRDFQFLQTLLIREKKQAELSIWLQNQGGIAGKITADIPQERLLTTFPAELSLDKVGEGDPAQRANNLAEYDLILAFDPDWSLCTEQQLQNLKTWVERGGGVIYVGGPIHTAELVRQEGAGIDALLEVLPIEPGDNELASIRRDTDRPWRLSFPEVNQETDFLKLDDEGNGLLAGWPQFFDDSDELIDDNTIEPVRGFFNFYPVKGTKPGATVMARFLDPDAKPRDSTKSAPWLVTMRVNEGRGVFLGSPEVWRLRSYRPAYFERFWLKLMRYASEGTRKKQSRRGRLLLRREVRQGELLRIRAQLYKPDLRPLEKTATPTFVVRKLGGGAVPARPFRMKATSARGDWDGTFVREVRAAGDDFPVGDYRLSLDVPKSSDTLTADFRVTENVSDPELADVRPDEATLRTLAGPVKVLESRVKDTELLTKLRRSLGGAKAKLAFRLENDRDAIGLIPQCLRVQKKETTSRGKVEDLWDDGVELPLDRDPPVVISYLLLLVALLLSVEWATRKLLQLA